MPHTTPQQQKTKSPPRMRPEILKKCMIPGFEWFPTDEEGQRYAIEYIYSNCYYLKQLLDQFDDPDELDDEQFLEVFDQLFYVTLRINRWHADPDPRYGGYLDRDTFNETRKLFDTEKVERINLAAKCSLGSNLK